MSDASAHVSLRAVRALVRGLEQAIVVCSADGTITFVGGAITTLLGYHPHRVEGRNVLDFVRPDQRDEILESLIRWTGREGTPAVLAYDLLASDGSWVPMRYELMIGPEAAEFGDYVFTFSAVDAVVGDGTSRHDLLERVLNEDRLVRLASVFLRYAVDEFELGLEGAMVELSGLDWLTRVSVWELDLDHASPAGQGPSVRRRIEWTANASAPTVELPEVVHVGVSPVLQSLFALEEVQLRPLDLVADGWEDTRRWFEAAGVQSAIAVPMAVEGVFRGFILAEVTHPDVVLGVTVVSTLRSAAAILASAFRRHEAEVELNHRARTDVLTGLPNRWAFDDELARALGSREAGASRVVVGIVNLDRFARVNSALGRIAGDQLLIDAARRLHQRVAPGTLLARSQGDEFLLLFAPGTDLVAAREIGDALVSSIEAPFQLGGEIVTVSASAGLAVADAPGVLDGEGDDGAGQAGAERGGAERGGAGDDGAADGAADVLAAGSELVRRADVAMRRARQLGGGRVESDDETSRGRVTQHLRRESELRAALVGGGIEVHLQPEWDIATREIIGAEALARWNHPTDGLLTADAFIPLAEESGLIVDLGAEVFRVACATVAGWDAAAVPESFELKVNLSAHQLTPDLPGVVADVLATTGLAPPRLCFELTESALMRDPQGSITVLEALRAQGVGLAIDDFGTGYSSMLYLKRLPVTLLKVDLSFVAGLPDGLHDRAIIRAIVELANSLAIDVTAEGVETEAQLEALLELGCRRAQGFLLGRPAPASVLLETLTAARSI